MQPNEGQKSRFSPGDVVSHHEWGVGRVVEVKTEPEAHIIVDFPNKRSHQIKAQLANDALHKLPADGLEALLLREPDKVAQWGQHAPLKLIGAALADLERPARVADLKAKLHGRDLLTSKWETWWKRVQPVVKESPLFDVGVDRSYRLVSQVDQIPEEPLPSAPKKVRPTRMSGTQVQEMASELEAGQIKFESLKGAKNLRMLAREIVRRTSASQGARAAIRKALDGPVLPIRFILEELSSSGRPTESIEVLLHYTDSIQVLARRPGREKGTKVGEHIVAKLHLLDDTTKRLAEHHQLPEDPLPLSPFVKALLQLALTIRRESTSTWRSEAVDCVSSAMASLAAGQPSVFDIVGEYLATQESDISRKVAVTGSLLARVPPACRSEAVDRLLIRSLVGPPEFAEECFARYLGADEQLNWLSSALQRSCDTTALEVLARLLRRKSTRLDAQEQVTCLELAIGIASVSRKAHATLGPLIMDRLKERLDVVSRETSQATLRASLESVLDVIEGTALAKVNEERETFAGIRANLESNMTNLQEAVQTSRRESARLKEMVEQLKSSYHLPEQWTEFKGKKEVLEGLAGLYQEISLAKESGVDAEATAWVLQRLQNVLLKHGVSKFGQMEGPEDYDPALHQFIPGFEGTGKEVKIQSPGFQWQDPAGNKITLARAKVVKY